MSRTYRRKNTRNKTSRLAEFLQTADERFDTRIHRFSQYWRPRYDRRFENMEKDKVLAIASAKFHSETWLDDELIENLYKKGWNKFLRNKGKQQLAGALKNEENEELLPTSKKEATWWYDWAYYW